MVHLIFIWSRLNYANRLQSEFENHFHDEDCVSQCDEENDVECECNIIREIALKRRTALSLLLMWSRMFDDDVLDQEFMCPSFECKWRHTPEMPHMCDFERWWSKNLHLWSTCSTLDELLQFCTRIKTHVEEEKLNHHHSSRQAKKSRISENKLTSPLLHITYHAPNNKSYILPTSIAVPNQETLQTTINIGQLEFWNLLECAIECNLMCMSHTLVLYVSRHIQ